ncbi:uncharacterized protein [Dermacentor andersoni]|uniref:uncharacterized protein n=1 Tax=Dermacentor andersoni TaxID=34620 RepID=UPI002154FAC2|nr:uncharacterized protein LOC126533243 [Dermacentor andersoni]XP_054927806.1 uncharacterized protein LOC126533243 [Dermacentor andersoni]XP_054927807.1 uncharacterized protein LOC126533243 [Dermacentor andersoni]
MALLYVFHLLCISVAPLVAYPHESQVNDTKDLLLPRSKHPNCWHVPPRIVPRCIGNAYAFRFRYDWYTEKCEEFDDCETSTTGFDTREECLNGCNPDSVCLKLGWKYGGPYRTWYTYDSEEDDCIATKTTISPSQRWPANNAFLRLRECRLACMPTFVQDIYY